MKLKMLVSALALLASFAAGAQPVSPEQRARDLNRQLTDDERMTLILGNFAMPWQDKPIPEGAIPSAGYVRGVPRLGIPALYETDASLGVANPGGYRQGDRSTALPSGMALAATFNPDIAFAGGAMIGAEARSKGFNVLLAGGINLARNPFNGRNFEYAGEDPLLAGVLVGASIRGIQSNKMVSTIKHFALNDQETGRHRVNALIDEAALRESDLLAFQIAIERGKPGSVMCAYNLVNGHYACGNDFLLNKVLKGDWKYPGWVMSDWGAVYSTDFAAKGLDQESGQELDNNVWFEPSLIQSALADGTLKRQRLEDMTGRILRSMAENGLLDYEPSKPGAPVDFDKHLAVARAQAAEAIVLLRNENKLLPLSKDTRCILVVGGHADLGVLSGGGSSQVMGDTDPQRTVRLGGLSDFNSPRNMRFHGKAPLTAIRDAAPAATVTYDDGRYPAATAELARTADVVIIFANQWANEGEDLPNLSLPDAQDALIEQVSAANPKTVVVLQTGGAVLMPWLNRTGAVISAWYSGWGGADAIGDVLFGTVNPSGRLPVTFPASAEQFPRAKIPGLGTGPKEQFDVAHPEGADVGYRWLARTGQKPLFPFGYGLSYTDYSFTDLKVESTRPLRLSFDVRNVGGVAGKAVPQLYLTSIGDKPVKRLVGFAKVALAPGQSVRQTVEIDPRLLAGFDAKEQRWRITATRYSISLASSSDMGGAKLEVPLPGMTMKP